jgi:sulfite exporter TauE/SafE
MENIAIAFVTGLTAGGLSCLAVQGGLLASSIATQAEKDVARDLANRKRKSGGRAAEYDRAVAALERSGLSHKKKNHALHELKRRFPRAQTEPAEPEKPHAARPIILFLGAKLAAYTLLGFVLGAAGSVVELSPFGRAILLIAVGIFMFGTAMRLLNVHPIFRYFLIEPPKRLTRAIRRRAKRGGGNDTVTPVFLGALTVFIPCGVTQAMIALAIATGNPAAGAAIMFSFVLGTIPLFFGLAYLATRLGERMHAQFLKAVAVILVILSLLSVETGLNLAGSPVSFAAVKNEIATENDRVEQGAPTDQSVAAVMENGVQVLTINALDTRYSPNRLTAQANVPTKLKLVTNGTQGCSRAFYIPETESYKLLPETGTEYIDLPAHSPGTLKFTCTMGMYTGQIAFK